MNEAARIAALEEWVRDKEGENLELKEAKNRFSFEDLAKYCAVLANEGGGRVILGVTNHARARSSGSKAFEQPDLHSQGAVRANSAGHRL